MILSLKKRIIGYGDFKTMKIKVTGIVQGVGFRPQVARLARSMRLKGYIKNVGSYVEIYVEDHDSEFLELLKHNLPPLAKIENIQVIEEPPSVHYEGFEIVESTEGYKNYMFPADVTICDECLKDLFDKNNRRYLYPFINCVNCGARYTVISDLPYDRKFTSMHKFRMCNLCTEEFYNEKNRRYDAQTISCSNCGPQYKLYDKSENLVDTDDPIKEYAKAIDAGAIGVAKSWGGLHISVILENIAEFRKWYKRPTKPFAVMVRNLNTAKKYANITKEEVALLISKERPIVLVEKKDFKDPILDLIAPGLPNIGLYLPYAGLHYILFHHLKHDSIVNTSGNFSNEPMIIDNHLAFELGADYYLLHNRDILNRVDDSVVRIYKNHNFFIRRSRGYVPDILKVDYQKILLSLGAEMNSKISISKDGYMFSSQYLGDISYYHNLLFLEETVHKFIKMLDVNNLEGIAIDLHPQYSYHSFAEKLAEKYNVKIIKVQHHHAHAATLLYEHNLDRIIAITLDGTGYGTDGKIWGGEILNANYESFERIASLQELPLIGGEIGIKNPIRLVYGINELLNEPLDLQYDRNLYSKLIKTAIKTTSFGRVLDALSAYLGICDVMHYDGEPAMKLETYLYMGSNSFELETDIQKTENRRIIKVLPLFHQLFELDLKTEKDKADAAYSFVYTLLEKFAEIALDYSDSYDLSIGLSGGVSYNFILNAILESLLKNKDLKLHKQIPNGDNGISIGQNLIAARL